MKFWKKRIYADAAAATPLSRSVQKEMHRLEKLFANPGGLHREAVAAKKELESARMRAAHAVGAHADEIIFTSGGTEANNLAIFGALRQGLHEHGELNAVTAPIEHPSVLEPLKALERDGLYITYLPVDKEGKVNPKDVREAVNDETVFVSVQMVNSEIGTIQPVRDIAKEIRHVRKTRVAKLPLYFHTDASQAPLWLPLNVEKLGIDLMTLDAQKMMGPKGSGLLYVRRGTELEPLLFGGGQERGLRSGTENAVLAGALAEALANAQEGVDERAAQVAEVRDYLWSEIQTLLPGAVLNGPACQGLALPRGGKARPSDARVANNLNISVPGLDGQMATVALDAKGVAVSTRSACSTADEEPSPVLQAIGAGEQAAREAVRITLLPDARLRDARAIAIALKKVADRYRNVVH